VRQSKRPHHRRSRKRQGRAQRQELIERQEAERARRGQCRALFQSKIIALGRPWKKLGRPGLCPSFDRHWSSVHFSDQFSRQQRPDTSRLFRRAFFRYRPMTGPRTTRSDALGSRLIKSTRRSLRRGRRTRGSFMTGPRTTRSDALDDRPEPPHRGGTRKTVVSGPDCAVPASVGKRNHARDIKQLTRAFEGCQRCAIAIPGKASSAASIPMPRPSTPTPRRRTNPSPRPIGRLFEAREREI
jgi:hypothetical protein